ncbi:hypothetical protein B5X24_HaOG213996 [Helicoverpa armigera]|nr:hypothetical protein B5X24_HaOG213996 [Helicoverpa armigera]
MTASAVWRAQLAWAQAVCATRRNIGLRPFRTGRRRTCGLPQVAVGPRPKRPTGGPLMKSTGAPGGNGGATHQSSFEEDASAFGSDRERRADFAKTMESAFRQVALKKKASRDSTIKAATSRSFRDFFLRTHMRARVLRFVCNRNSSAWCQKLEPKVASGRL